VVKDSTPGYPYTVLGANNGMVLEQYGSFIWQSVSRQWNAAIALGEEVFSLGPSEPVRAGVCDPIKVFIKDEPHKLSKITSGKLRIISGCSLVDQIKTRLLCKRQNKSEIANWESTPSKPGLGLHDDGLLIIEQVAREFFKHGKVAETDVSGWDWSVKDWELSMDAEARRRLAGARKGGLFDFLLRVHAHCVANSVFVTPDGCMFEQTIPGKQLSGDYNTSSTNSRMRVMASMLARVWSGRDPLVDGRVCVAAMGDDSFEVSFAGLQEQLNAMGHVVRFVKENEVVEGLAFCSQIFDGQGGAYPEDPSKTVYRFLSHKPGDPAYLELWAQLSWYLRHLKSPELRVVIEKMAMGRIERSENLRNGNPSTTSSAPTKESASKTASGAWAAAWAPERVKCYICNGSGQVGSSELGWKLPL